MKKKWRILRCAKKGSDSNPTTLVSLDVLQERFIWSSAVFLWKCHISLLKKHITAVISYKGKNILNCFKVLCWIKVCFLFVFCMCVWLCEVLNLLFSWSFYFVVLYRRSYFTSSLVIYIFIIYTFFFFNYNTYLFTSFSSYYIFWSNLFPSWVYFIDLPYLSFPFFLFHYSRFPFPFLPFSLSSLTVLSLVIVYTYSRFTCVQPYNNNYNISEQGAAVFFILIIS